MGAGLRAQLGGAALLSSAQLQLPSNSFQLHCCPTPQGWMENDVLCSA